MKNPHWTRDEAANALTKLERLAELLSDRPEYLGAILDAHKAISAAKSEAEIICREEHARAYGA